jgi:hypothetical protein
MANELLKSSEGDAVPQNLRDGVSVSASDLSGDDTVWEIFKDPAKGGGSTLQDVVDTIGGTLEVTDDGSFNATVDGAIEIDADDGNGNVSSIQRTDNALHSYLAGQDVNISVDLKNQSVDAATETTLSNLDSNFDSVLASNAEDALQVEQQSPVILEANDQNSVVDSIYRTNNSLNTQVTGQDSNFEIDLENDNTVGLAKESTLSDLAATLVSNGNDEIRVEVQNATFNVVEDVSQVFYEGSTYSIQTTAGTVSTNSSETIITNDSGSQKIVILSYNFSIEGSFSVFIESSGGKRIDAIEGDSSPVEDSRDPKGPIGETNAGEDLNINAGGSTITVHYRFSFIKASV